MFSACVVWFGGLGFCEADDMRPGGQVVNGGRVRTVRLVKRDGKDAPYFHFTDWSDDVPEAGDYWVSWQRCGTVRR